MGFILQLGSNGVSRLLYLYLVTFLAGQDAGYAAAHATLLGYAMSLIVLFGLNVYQHTIARYGDNLARALDSCSFQYRFLLIAESGVCTVVLVGLMLGWHLPLGLLAVLVGLGLAQSEVTFSMVTAHGMVWRPLLYYGSQSIFFACYLLLVWQKMPVVPTVLISVVPLFLINHWAYVRLRSTRSLLARENLAARLEEYRDRASTLLAIAPVIVTVPALIYLMGNHTGHADQIPQLLLFISFGGAVVFIMGNTYQFYGRDMVRKLLAYLNAGQWRILLALTMGVIASCFLLTIPIGVLIEWMKAGKVEYWPLQWYLCIGVFAAGTALTQWYSAICVGLKRSLYITIPNAIYFFTAILFSGFDFFIFYYVIMISAIIRCILQGMIFSARFT